VTNHPANIKMGEPGGVTLKWPGIAGGCTNIDACRVLPDNPLCAVKGYVNSRPFVQEVPKGC